MLPQSWYNSTLRHFPGWVVLVLAEIKALWYTLWYKATCRNMQYAVPGAEWPSPSVPRPCPTSETIFSGGLPKMQKQLPIALNYLVLCTGMCPQPMSLHVCISPAASEWAVCKHKGRYFLLGQFFLGEHIMGEGAIIHILDVGRRLLHLNKIKFNFRWTFHSL